MDLLAFCNKYILSNNAKVVINSPQGLQQASHCTITLFLSNRINFISLHLLYQENQFIILQKFCILSLFCKSATFDNEESMVDSAWKHYSVKESRIRISWEKRVDNYIFFCFYQKENSISHYHHSSLLTNASSSLWSTIHIFWWKHEVLFLSE